MKHTFFLVVLTLSIIAACEVDDEPTIIADPYVTFKFVDGDSIELLTNSLSSYESTNTILNEEITTLESSLSSLQTGIDSIFIGLDSGNLIYENLYVELKAQYTLDSADRISLLEEIILTEDILDSLSGYILELNTGNILLESIEAVFSGYVEDGFKDTTDLYEVPLNIQDTFSEYIINFDGLSYAISFTHTNTQRISSRQTYYIHLSDIMLYQYEFDTVIDNCGNSNCDANEAVFTCYY